MEEQKHLGNLPWTHARIHMGNPFEYPEMKGVVISESLYDPAHPNPADARVREAKVAIRRRIPDYGDHQDLVHCRAPHAKAMHVQYLHLPDAPEGANVNITLAGPHVIELYCEATHTMTVKCERRQSHSMHGLSFLVVNVSTHSVP